MRKIEAGYYEGQSNGKTFRVYRVEKRVYHGFARKHARRDGSYTFASSRKETDWGFKIEGQDAARGYGTKGEAMNAAIRCLNSER